MAEITYDGHRVLSLVEDSWDYGVMLVWEPKPKKIWFVDMEHFLSIEPTMGNSLALTVQERLKDPRMECGLTLEQLAEQTHLSKSALGSYETENFKDISHYALKERID